MARTRKPQPTLDSIFFSSPEQRVVRFLLSEPTTAFTPRVISSRLKGIRGLGGADGITEILKNLHELGLVNYCDNLRAVRVVDEAPAIKILKTFSALCDLEGLREQLAPISKKGILYGARAQGESHSESPYDLVVVSHEAEEVKRISAQHPLGKKIELLTLDPDQYSSNVDKVHPGLTRKLTNSVVLWGTSL
jgi:hypothetical protein